MGSSLSKTSSKSKTCQYCFNKFKTDNKEVMHCSMNCAINSYNSSTRDDMKQETKIGKSEKFSNPDPKSG